MQGQCRGRIPERWPREGSAHRDIDGSIYNPSILFAQGYPQESHGLPGKCCLVLANVVLVALKRSLSDLVDVFSHESIQVH